MWLDDDDKEFNNDKETLHLQKTNLAMLIPSCLFKEKICFIRRKTFSFTTVHILVKSVVGVPSRKIENIDFLSQSFGRTTISDKINQVVRAHFAFYYD